MGGRNLALLLVLLILLAELVLSGKGRSIWQAAWSGPYGLGHATPLKNTVGGSAPQLPLNQAFNGIKPPGQPGPTGTGGIGSINQAR